MFEILILILILTLGFGLDAIKKAIEKSHFSFDQSELENIVEQLGRISIALGADEAVRKKKIKDREDLKVRVIAQLVRSGSSKNEAEKEAERFLQKDEYSFSVEKWVKLQEEDERLEEEYGHLFDKAENYVVDLKKRWKKGDSIDMKAFEKQMGASWEAQEWLMKRLAQRNLVVETTKWDNEFQSYHHNGWALS